MSFHHKAVLTLDGVRKEKKKGEQEMVIQFAFNHLLNRERHLEGTINTTNAA